MIVRARVALKRTGDKCFDNLSGGPHQPVDDFSNVFQNVGISPFQAKLAHTWSHCVCKIEQELEKYLYILKSFCAVYLLFSELH